MYSLELLHTQWMECWINGLIKCLFELLHPNELLIIVVLSEVRQKMCPCLHKIIPVTATATVSVFNPSDSFSIEGCICVRPLIKGQYNWCLLLWKTVINIAKSHVSLSCRLMLIPAVSSNAVTVQYDLLYPLCCSVYIYMPFFSMMHL